MHRVICALAISAALAACQTPMTRTESAAVGAATGAAVGAAVADEDRLEGALIGGTVGAAAGTLLGRTTTPGQCLYRDARGNRFLARC